MIAKIRHLYELIVGAILAFLGLGGCSQINKIINGVDEYGMPHANYKIIGEVTSEDGKPIQGIKVKYRRLEYTDDEGNKQYFESEENEFLTDKEGKVNANAFDWSTEPKEITITLEDIDGAENGGEFEGQVLSENDLTIDYEKDEDGRWHQGDFTISFNAKLKPATSEE
ncbi:MAG: radical SAM-associated putative lipoprotein [Bacteroidales bacterium]|nr:radical SAM-associated putative lipoprotein [Bacteroidales bacterium]